MKDFYLKLKTEKEIEEAKSILIEYGIIGEKSTFMKKEGIYEVYFSYVKNIYEMTRYPIDREVRILIDNKESNTPYWDFKEFIKITDAVSRLNSLTTNRIECRTDSDKLMLKKFFDMLGYTVINGNGRYITLENDKKEYNAISFDQTITVPRKINAIKYITVKDSDDSSLPTIKFSDFWGIVPYMLNDNNHYQHKVRKDSVIYCNNIADLKYSLTILKELGYCNECSSKTKIENIFIGDDNDALGDEEVVIKINEDKKTIKLLKLTTSFNKISDNINPYSDRKHYKEFREFISNFKILSAFDLADNYNRLNRKYSKGITKIIICNGKKIGEIKELLDIFKFEGYNIEEESKVKEILSKFSTKDMVIVISKKTIKLVYLSDYITTLSKSIKGNKEVFLSNEFLKEIKPVVDIDLVDKRVDEVIKNSIMTSEKYAIIVNTYQQKEEILGLLKKKGFLWIDNKDIFPEKDLNREYLFKKINEVLIGIDTKEGKIFQGSVCLKEKFSSIVDYGFIDSRFPNVEREIF